MGSDEGDPSAREPAAKRRERIAALRALPDDERARLALVLPLFEDEDYGVRREAVLVVSRLASVDEAMTIAVHALEGEHVQARSAATELVVRYGDRAIAKLNVLARHPREGVRRLVADALVAIATPATNELLDLLSSDESPSVAAVAVEGLARSAPKDRLAQVAIAVAEGRRHPFVALAALLACERRDVVLPTAVLDARAKDPLTAVVAMRLLGRAGERESILAGLARAQGVPLRAALAGVAELVVRDPIPTRAALRSRALPVDETMAIVPGLDRGMLAGAVVLAAAADRVDLVERVLLRDDVDHAWGDLERVLAAFGGTNLAARLEEAAREREGDPRAMLSARLFALARAVPQSLPRKARALDLREEHLADETWQRLVALCAREAGLAFDDDARPRVEARLAALVREAGLPSFDAYVARIGSGDDDELGRALSALTVHETYLYREPRQLDALRKDVLPAIARESDDARPFRVWSAGCSTGEEAWTLAMILDEARALRQRSSSILATDLSGACIEEAKAGVYGRRSLRGEIPPTLRARGLVALSEGRVQVHDRLRASVSFSVANLVDGPPEQGVFDVVMCRNVLIYLTRAARAEVIASFFAALRPGGVLFLGHSESLLQLDTPFRFVSVDKSIFYARPRRDGSVPFDEVR